MIRFRFVLDNQADLPIAKMCALVEVPRSSFYAWVNHADPGCAVDVRGWQCGPPGLNHGWCGTVALRHRPARESTRLVRGGRRLLGGERRRLIHDLALALAARRRGPTQLVLTPSTSYLGGFTALLRSSRIAVSHGVLKR